MTTLKVYKLLVFHFVIPLEIILKKEGVTIAKLVKAYQSTIQTFWTGSYQHFQNFNFDHVQLSN